MTEEMKNGPDAAVTEGTIKNETDAAVTDEHFFSAAEAMLFATGRAVSVWELAEAAGVERERAEALMKRFADAWNAREGGTEIVALDDGWQMCARKELYPELIALELHPRQPHLTDVLLETLSVIAYRQPVTKAEIERIRGVNSDHAVNRLVEFELVQELGRAKQPGRPILFGTTKEFLRVFGVSSREQLPEISPLRLEDFRAEAEAEAGGGGPASAAEEEGSKEAEAAAAEAVSKEAESAAEEGSGSTAPDAEGGTDGFPLIEREGDAGIGVGV